MKKIIIISLILSMVFSTQLIAASAESTAAGERDIDGTLILDEYPEVQGSSEKEALAEIYNDYTNGKASKSELADALDSFYNAVGDTEAIESVSSEPMLKSKVSTRATSGYISGLVQNPQENGYYCGPAAAQSILGALDVDVDQSELASDDNLQTEIWESTPWYVDSTTQYVMRNVLNDYTGTTYYSVKAAPTGSQITTYIKFDVGTGYGIAASFHILKSASTRPAGYPSNKTIGHWVAIRGYSNSGSTISWADPAYNGVGLSSSWNLTSAYLTDTATNVASYVNSRGVIW